MATVRVQVRARAGLGRVGETLLSEGCQCTGRDLALTAGNITRLGYLASVARKTEGEAGIKEGWNQCS